MMETIALPLIADRVSGHFGHAEVFAFVSLDPANPTTRTRRDETPPAHEPGVLPRWLAEQGATVVIAGGMGGRAIELLEQNSIRCLLGVPSLSVDEAIERYRASDLPTGQVACGHDDGAPCPGH